MVEAASHLENVCVLLGSLVMHVKQVTGDVPLIEIGH